MACSVWYGARLWSGRLVSKRPGSCRTNRPGRVGQAVVTQHRCCGTGRGSLAVEVFVSNRVKVWGVSSISFGGEGVAHRGGAGGKQKGQVRDEADDGGRGGRGPG